MTRPILKPYDLGPSMSGDRAISWEEQDEDFAAIARALNGNLDVGNLKRGTRFAVDFGGHPADEPGARAANIVPYGWLEPNSIAVLRGLVRKNGDTTVTLGSIPALYGNLKALRASAILIGATPGTSVNVRIGNTGGYTTIAVFNVFAPLSPIASSGTPQVGYTRDINAITSGNLVSAAITGGANAGSIVEVAFKIPHQV